MLTALAADTDFAALDPAVSVHPQSPLSEPAWPFVKYGSPSSIPVLAACVDGDEITVSLHSFAKPRYDAGVIVESAEDHADRIGTAVVRALHGQRLAIGVLSARVQRTGCQLLQDGDEADAYHHVANFRVRILS